MRKILSACLSLAALAAGPDYTSIMVTKVVDAGGNSLANGTATFQCARCLVMRGSEFAESIRFTG
jgi:hypothetical protein